jgi:hypothetical protein
LIPHSL